ncbi:S-adenosyl-L-methionine-dependent methyltransferase [Xylaria arbuscula]|nr:S-adenosyl-L-methionine-dependent methyltransferase [Xylaria arbuscula]
MPTVSFGEPLITYRSDLSTLYRVFRKTARPIRSHILKVEGDFPAGSPRLEKHPQRIRKVNIEERLIKIGTSAKSCSIIQEENLWVYEFLSPDYPIGDKSKFKIKGNHIVYFFAGGGFVQPAASEQWKFCAYLASSLAREGVRVVLISYPLAPNSPAKDSLPVLRRWLAQALRKAEVENSTVSLVGDSAGGNIALSLALWWADQLALGRKVEAKEAAARSSLHSVFMISPPLDMRVINPDIARQGFTLSNNNNKSIFSIFADEPERGDRFGRYFSGFDFAVDRLLEEYPWAEKTTVVNVGGSHSSVAISITERFPNIKCVVQDLPNTISKRASLLPAYLHDRVSFMAYDFFKPQPIVADVYYSRSIFHNWADKYCIKILQNLIPAMRPGARVIIHERIPPGLEKLNNLDALRAINLDVGMQQLLNAQQREMHEWAELFYRADPRFRYLGAHHPHGAIRWIIEAEWQE